MDYKNIKVSIPTYEFKIENDQYNCAVSQNVVNAQVKGDKGEPGKDGFSPIVSLNKLDNGTVLTIRDARNTETVLILDGEKGEKGERGNDGYTPIKGVDYFDGEKGERGEKGDKGDRGEQGERGPQGFTGATGLQGPKGETGERGPQGIQGIQGPRGETGLKGEDGYTPVKGVDYFDGERGPQGIQGETGPQGPAGHTPTNAELTTLINTQGYIKTETDPTVPSWAKASTKPSYTATEVGASPSNHNHDTVYAKISQIPSVPTNLSSFINDSNFVNESQVNGLIDAKLGSIETILEELL